MSTTTYKEGDRVEVLMEAVFQECFEREITKAERNINNKGKTKQWIYNVDFKVIDEKPGPLARDEIHRLTFKPLDPMERYVPGSKWRVPLWCLSPDPYRILHVYSRREGEKPEEGRRSNWQLMAVIMRGDLPIIEGRAEDVEVKSSKV